MTAHEELPLAHTMDSDSWKD